MTIRCHSAFKHYEMFHGNAACCGGSRFSNTSIFNINYSGGGNGGGFWGGVGAGIGYGLSNWLGGFLNNMGFGGGMGWGMPSFGMWNWGGSTGPSSRSSDSQDDKDIKIIDKYIKQVDALRKKTSPLNAKDSDALKELRTKLKEYSETPEDSKNEAENKRAYKHLLDLLNEKFPETSDDETAPGNKPQADDNSNKPGDQSDNTTPGGNGDGTVTAPGEQGNNTPPAPTTEPPVSPEDTENDDDWKSLTWNDTESDYGDPDGTVRANCEAATNENIGELNESNLERADDVSPITDPYWKKNGNVTISNQKKNGFPVYITIRNRHYKLLESKSDEKHAYYVTPNKDNNKNIYILTYNKSSGKFFLDQPNNTYKGFGIKDTQEEK